MSRITITAESLTAEALELQRRITAGTETFKAAADAELGSCERDVVFRCGNVVLYRYRPLCDERIAVPVVIVYALVNRPNMMDLQRDRSLIRGLLERGLELYLIDWGYPSGADQMLGLDDYINGYIGRCVDFVRGESGEDKVNVFGVCQGGTFSVCYAALHPAKVRNLVTTITPIDFHTPNDMLSHLFRHVDMEQLAGSNGNVPGDLLNAVFLSLKPFRLAQAKYVHLFDDPNNHEAAELFMRMEKWIFDSPDLAGVAFREFARSFYQDNALIKGEVRIGGNLVSLQNIRMPVLNIYAEQDHLVPPAASLALADHVGTDDYQALGFPGGHIGLYVSTKAHGILPQAIAQWLAER